jgi:Xaa-Pro aminopeptidase
MPLDLQLAGRALSAAKADVLVASDPFTVTWLTGFAPDVLYGPSPFAAGPVAVVEADRIRLLVSADEAEGAAATGCEVLTYEGFTTGRLDPHGYQAEALGALGLRGPVAVELHALTLSLARVLPVEVRDASAALRRARAVKTPWQLERIRAAIALCDAGQAAARELAQPGISELDLQAGIQAAMERAAGERLPLLDDLVSGRRTADIGGYPSSRTLVDGDLVIVDLVPRLDGFFGDSCATLSLGAPPAGADELHAAALAGLERGLAALRPGLVAGELDALVREGLDYPHHTGHGLGAATHEEPRIVPGGQTVLEAGMVVALEPGGYPGPFGLRVEHVAVVTDGGCEVLSGHSLTL